MQGQKGQILSDSIIKKIFINFESTTNQQTKQELSSAIRSIVHKNENFDLAIVQKALIYGLA